MGNVLQAQGIAKRYGKVEALSELSLTVPSGAIYGLVGKNGSGKTTLIRVICGLQLPTRGEYSLFGINHRDKKILTVRRRMGAVVETPSLYQNMSGACNLTQQCYLLGEDTKKVGELLKLVGLDDAGSKKVKNYSLGMKQRLSIAMAMCGEPDFMILDEPNNGLDPQGIVEIRELILKLNREKGISFLISSHVLDELARIATHFGFVDGGRIIREITSDELMRECRKCVRLTVSDVKVFGEVMEKSGFEYSINPDGTVDIFGEAGVTKVVTALNAAGCEVDTWRECDETLESYYLNLVGGGAA